MFYVLLTGQGEGCDYCIDCNKTFRKLKAKTWEEAEKEIAGICSNYHEPAIAKARILSVVNDQEFDVAAWRKRVAEKIARQAASELKQRRELYEQLKKEFDGNS